MGGSATIAGTASAVDLAKAVRDGKTSLGFRYRLEHVAQDGIDEDALASTARARLTWDSAETDDFAFGIEVRYAADEHASDIAKLWLMLDWKW